MSFRSHVTHIIFFIYRSLLGQVNWPPTGTGNDHSYIRLLGILWILVAWFLSQFFGDHLLNGLIVHEHLSINSLDDILDYYGPESKLLKRNPSMEPFYGINYPE